MFIPSLAYKYAFAYLNQYREHINPSMLDTIKNVATKLHKKKSLLSFTSILEGDKEALGSLLCSYVANEGLDQPPWKSLILLLVDHKRVPMLPVILQAIILLYQKEEGLTPCTVSSSVSLNDSQKQKIETFIRKKIAKKGTITYDISKKLIAGLRVMTREVLWEHSVNKKLQRLRALIAREYGGY